MGRIDVLVQGSTASASASGCLLERLDLAAQPCPVALRTTPAGLVLRRSDDVDGDSDAGSLVCELLHGSLGPCPLDSSSAPPVPTAAVSVVLSDARAGATHVLVTRRAPSLRHGPGYWALPGGHVAAAMGRIDVLVQGSTASASASGCLLERLDLAAQPCPVALRTTPAGLVLRRSDDVDGDSDAGSLVCELLHGSLGPCPLDSSSAPPVPTAAVSVVLSDARAGATRLLVTRRAPSLRHGPGYWALPGGHVEAGETLEAAAVRELAEETGAGVEGAPHVVAAFEVGGAGSHFVIVTFAAAAAAGGRPLRYAPDEVGAAAWLDAGHVAALCAGRDVEVQAGRVLPDGSLAPYVARITPADCSGSSDAPAEPIAPSCARPCLPAGADCWRWRRCPVQSMAEHGTGGA
eukprot:m51a1_g8568 hypothetical protein (406) ;mRNA; r:188203-190133